MIDGSVRFETVAERNLCMDFMWRVKAEMNRCYAEADPNFSLTISGGDDVQAGFALLCVMRTEVDTQAQMQYVGK